jgi:5-methylcytosine-specific restriction protein A
MPTRIDFETELERQLVIARNSGREYKVIISGDLHRSVGGFPGPDHRMPTCCAVMRNRMRENDKIINQPLKGNGASLQIKYNLI